MKKQILITAIACISIAYGCGDSMKKENNETSNLTQPVLSEPEKSEHHATESDSIEFNNGAKWIVVPDMMKHIRNMESDIHQFSKTAHAELIEYSKLGASLQKNIDLLTSNCTMEGKPHDELHKWLLPYIDMVDKLNKSSNTEEAQKMFIEIVSSFKMFNIYFE